MTGIEVDSGDCGIEVVSDDCGIEVDSGDCGKDGTEVDSEADCATEVDSDVEVASEGWKTLPHSPPCQNHKNHFLRHQMSHSDLILA